MTLLETDRLRLRPITDDDLERLVELDSDPEVVRYITDGRPTPRAFVEQVVLPRMRSFAGGVLPGFLAAHDRADDRFLGWFHLRPDSVEPTWSELGYRLRREVWGRGLATEGTLALMAEARRRVPGGVLSARTMTGNLASRRVMEKVGLTFSGTCVFPARDWPGFPMPAAEGVVYTGR